MLKAAHHAYCISRSNHTSTPSSVLFPLPILFKSEISSFLHGSVHNNLQLYRPVFVGPDWKPKLFSHAKAHIIKDKPAVNKAVTSERTILHGY